jgi:anti-sigma B factor antagonist
MLATIRMETHHEHAPIAHISGEIDASNAPAFAAQLKDAVPNSAMGLVLDLSETTYLDSSGVHLIFDVAEALRRRQQVLQLVVPSDSFIGDVLAVVNLAGAAGIAPSLEQALAALEAPAF